MGDLDPLLLTVEQAARLLNINRHKLFDLLRDGDLESVAIGTKRYRDDRETAALRRISRAAIDRYITGLEQAQQATAGGAA